MTPASRELSSAVRFVVVGWLARVGPVATLLFALRFGLGVPEKADSVRLLSRSWIRGAPEVADLAVLSEVVGAGETLGFSGRLTLILGLGLWVVLVAGLVLDGSPDK